MREENNKPLQSIGNDFIAQKTPLAPLFQAAAPSAFVANSQTLPAEGPAFGQNIKHTFRPKRVNVVNLIHTQSVIVFALLLLMVGVATIEFGSRYIMAHDYPIAASSFVQTMPAIGGLNKTLSTASLTGFLNGLTDQTASLNLGSQTLTISPATIKSWLTITPNLKTGQDYVHIDAANISNSLSALVNQYVITPLNQVTITRSDGSSEVAIAGQNGTKLDPSVNLSSQSITIAKNLFSNKGFSVNAPLITLPYQSVTPAAFSKLIVVDLNSKKMYLYQNGQLINTFLVSAGKPSTPTPVGEFHIWDKLTSQTMVGPGYVQPNVPYVNYFDHRGDAIHGVYWRPASVFGNVNTSHGCVGVPVATSEYIFNWAPIGTTVITTPN